MYKNETQDGRKAELTLWAKQGMLNEEGWKELEAIHKAEGALVMQKLGIKP